MLVTTEKDWKRVQQRLWKTRDFAIDTETSGLDNYPRAGRKPDTLAGFSLYSDGVECYVPIAHTQGKNLRSKRWTQELQRLVDHANRIRIFHVQFDDVVLRRAGVRLPRTPKKVYCVFIMSWIVDDWTRGHSLKRLAIRRIDPTAAYSDARLKTYIAENKIVRYSDVPSDVMAQYAAEDAKFTWHLFDQYWDVIQAREHLPAILDTDMEAVWQYIDLVGRGVPISLKRCDEYATEAHKKAEAVQERIRRETGIKDLKLGSPAQLERVFGFDASDDLSMIRSGHRYVSPIMEFRAWTKMASSFYVPMRTGFKMRGYPELVGGVSSKGRVHPDLTMAGTPSTRTRCSRPPAQAFPRPVTKGVVGDWEPKAYKARNIVMAEPGKTLVLLDWNQIELRFTAHYSMSPVMIDAFLQGKDLHAMTTRQMFNKVTKETRFVGKQVNFSSVFRIGPTSLANNLTRDGRPTEDAEAKKFLQAYDALYPEVGHLFQICERLAKERGFIEIWTGRRCHLVQGDADKAMSRLIQTGAAELIKRAMLRTVPICKKYGIETILQVHDEFFYLVPNGVVTQATGELMYACSYLDILGPGEETEFGVPRFRVPMTVSVSKSTKSWGDAKEWTPKSYLSILAKRAG